MTITLQKQLNLICKHRDSDLPKLLKQLTGRQINGRLSESTYRRCLKSGTQLTARSYQKFLASLRQIDPKLEKIISSANDQEKELNIPSMVVGFNVVNSASQKSLSNNLEGTYRLIRRYNGEDKLVNELFLIRGGDGDEVVCFLVNRRGSIYRGHSFKLHGIIYCYLFRSHEEFNFCARTITLAGPAAGKSSHISGVITRVTQKTAQAMTSDLLVYWDEKIHVDEEQLDYLEKCFDEGSKADVDILLCGKTPLVGEWDLDHPEFSLANELLNKPITTVSTENLMVKTR